MLLVGGGSGGHIYPNLAVAERLAPPESITPHLVVSQRPLDAEIAAASGLGWTAIPASPLGVRPRAGLRFLRDYRRGVAATARLIREHDVAAVLATGGFVSGPAVAAAKAAGVPVALVSLDAVPGRANRWTARKADAVFSAYASADGLSGAEVVGFPLRRSAISHADSAEARKHFGLEPDRRTLLVFAGSQGAKTINEAMARLYGGPSDALRGWQVLHVTGPQGSPLTDSGSVKEFSYCDRMDLAWCAADAAVTRAGAGTVAEAWANAVPCVMLPYPFHKDEHQKHNAAPLVELGGAVVVKDRVDPAANAAALVEVFASMLNDDAKRQEMSDALRAKPPADGAQRLADWIVSQVAP
ncbi:MAG: UDP-N-acetylglucosamine--N-acetylmuramyl-(pentapeptide) pyrophosphoryl-undecaprenol N-acetylglucosamine transferase [Planctomycetota bacterium]